MAGANIGQGSRSESVLTVLHQEKSGWHIFTSNQLPGLFLTGRTEDYTELFESLPSTISALLTARAGRQNARVQVFRVAPDEGMSSSTTPDTLLHFAIETAA
jgi:hypothetical protein